MMDLRWGPARYERPLGNRPQGRGPVCKRHTVSPFGTCPWWAAEHVIAEADGTMICTVGPGKRNRPRPRDWKEMRLVAAQALGSATTVYAATFGRVEEAGRRWGHCARQAGWGLKSRIHAVGDGADWIRLQSREVFREQEIGRAHV